LYLQPVFLVIFSVDDQEELSIMEEYRMLSMP
jgi:hypothetical protein